MSHNVYSVRNQARASITSTYVWPLFSVAIFLCSFFLSSLIPPLQSPDELDHLKRIYLLSKGQIMLENREGFSSGGMIDSGLASYIETYGSFRNRPDMRVSSDDIDLASNIRWAGTSEFSAASGTGYYFPLIYLPQAIGLAIGEKLGLAVDTSYRMSRFSALLSSALIIMLAFSIYRPPFIAAALLILPMSLFQFASATLDGISTALCVLAISCFARIATDRELSQRRLIYLLISCVLLVTSSRAHALPLFALVFGSYFYTKDKRALIGGLVSSILVIAWLGLSIKLTSNIQFKNAASTSDIALYYIMDPIALIKVIYHTIANESNISFYAQSFVGILGWLDTRFSSEVYKISYAAIACLGIISIFTARPKGLTAYRYIIILCAVASIALIFIALLVQWNAAEHPAVTIQGIQGRYFLIPALLLAYSLGTKKRTQYIAFQNLGFLTIFVFLLFSSYCTSSLMISRFYIAEGQQRILSAKVTPTAQLSTENPIKLFFDDKIVTDNIPIRSIAIMFASYARANSGEAMVTLVGANGEEYSFDLKIPSIQDNRYHVINLDNRSYTSGFIKAQTGGGVSVWQAEYDSGIIASCIVYEFSNGAKRYTKGCPRP
ncbi:DUF2142 domain-containing protein [Pseudomonas capeferrum]